MKTNELTRREMLKKISFYMGGAVSAPTIAAILAGCGEDTSETAIESTTLSWQPKAFSSSQATLVSEMAEIIIPRTDTPGAKDVGVPQLIDSIVAEAFTIEQRQQYLTGLDSFTAGVRDTQGKPFSGLDESTKIMVMMQLNRAALNRDDNSFTDEQKDFYRTTKELTLLGFFRSEVGATQVLQYAPVPGRYQGCVPLTEIGKAWATS